MKAIAPIEEVGRCGVSPLKWGAEDAGFAASRGGEKAFSPQVIFESLGLLGLQIGTNECRANPEANCGNNLLMFFSSRNLARHKPGVEFGNVRRRLVNATKNISFPSDVN